MDVAGSAVGIAALGIQICQGLLTYYDGWKDYEPDIASARDSITDLHETLDLLKENLDNGSLEAKRSERVKSCLKSCEGGLKQLSDKLEELRKHDNPTGFRQKARTQLQRSWYPFRKDTLVKLCDNVADIRERLKLALHVLQLAIQHTDRWRKIVEWLSPPDPWANHHAARDRHEPQSGAWLLRSDEYRKWKAGDIRHLWLYGKAGCGKTVLSSTVIEDLVSHCDDVGNVGFGIFFFTFSDVRKQSYADLLLSLVAQLGWNKPAIGLLQQAYEKPGRRPPSRDELEKVLLAAIDPYRYVLLALDALDESPEEHDRRSALLERLNHLAKVAPKLKLFATSRELGDIRDGMEGLNANPIPIAPAVVDRDIQKYVATQLARDRKLSQLNSKSTDLIKRTLADNSDGMFRWVHCQIQALKKLKGTKPKYIEEALRTLPTTLDETYERMLTSIPEMCQREAHTLLQWIAYSEEPMTLAQLSEASIVDPDAEIGVDIDNRGELEDTLEILAGLVSFVDPARARLGCPRVEEEDVSSFGNQTTHGSNQPTDVTNDGDTSSEPLPVLIPKAQLRLAHFSVLEYLESDRIRQSIVENFHLDFKKGHRHLTQSCLAYLEFYSNDGDKTSTKKDTTVYPLLEYAAHRWYSHARQQEWGELTREISLLTSGSLKLDWLTVWQPDSYRAWEMVADVGSGLYYAAYLGLHEVSQALIEAQNDASAFGGEYGFPLQAASLRGHTKIVQCLLEADASVRAMGGHFGTALHAAASAGDEAIIEMLLRAGPSINASDGTNCTPIARAAEYGRTKVVRMLLDVGADVNAGDALARAVGAYQANPEIVQMLLDAGADVDAGDALAIAVGAYQASPEIAQMLLDAGADVNAGDALARAAGAYQANPEIVQMLLDAGADVNVGDTLAKVANEYEANPEIVQMLLDAGAHVNAGNALSQAAYWGNSRVVQMLLSAGADVNAGGALTKALGAYKVRPEIVQMLLDAGADVTVDNALTQAVRNCEKEVVQMLLDVGADVNAGGALTQAGFSGNPEVVQMLLHAGADVNASLALQLAVEVGHAEIVQILLTAGAEVNDGPGGQYSLTLSQARRARKNRSDYDAPEKWDEIEAILLAAGAKEAPDEDLLLEPTPPLIQADARLPIALSRGAGE